MHDVSHKIAAVGSRSVDSAQAFIHKIGADKDVKAYGSYAEVFADTVRALSSQIPPNVPLPLSQESRLILGYHFPRMWMPSTSVSYFVLFVSDALSR